MSTRREVNVPRLIACLVMMLNQISELLPFPWVGFS
jgi:hypothetical protein